jgi:predicted TIM-barrel enzyme
VLAGVCGTDPFRLMDRFLGQVEDAGFAGVQNFPTVGLIDGVFRANLEETGMGYGLEVEMIRLAHERGLLTAPYVFDVESAEAMTRAGADVLVPHMGLTTKGSIGAHTAKTLDDCVGLIQAMHDAAVAINPDVIVLCHGGPIAEPEDAQYVLDRARGVVGFFGASSMERLPTEVALTENMRRFKAVRAASS